MPITCSGPTHPNRPRILYLAVAEGNGHLLRAHLLRTSLRRADIDVSVVTTSQRGVDWLAALGTPARRLSSLFGASYDAHHNLRERSTEWRLLGYLATTGSADALRIRRLARDADLIVNDAVHPLLLLGRWGDRVVHVCGESIWQALEAHVQRRGPSAVTRRTLELLRTGRESAFARITYVPGLSQPRRVGARSYRLPPLVAPTRRPRHVVRRDLGLAPGQPLAVIYFNAHFRDPALITRTERTLRARGYGIYGVSESAPAAPGWRRVDRDLSSVTAAADLVVSGAGAGTVQLTSSCSVPLLALVGDHPEQQRNVALACEQGHAVQSVPVTASSAQLDAAIARLERAERPPPRGTPPDDAWSEVFAELLAERRGCAHA